MTQFLPQLTIGRQNRVRNKGGPGFSITIRGAIVNLNAIIDVVLGLVMLYLLLGLICTVINEAIASFFKLRAWNLELTLRKLIDNEDFRNLVKDTGLMKSLRVAAGRMVGPSYIPPTTLSSSVVEALKKNANDKGAASDLESMIRKIEGNENFRDTLLALLRETDGNIDRFRESIGNWFDLMMERSSGVYKRWIRALSLLVAGCIVFALNADSIRIAEALWHDDALRTAIADEAIKQPDTETDKRTLAELRAELRPFPLGWNRAPEPASPSSSVRNGPASPELVAYQRAKAAFEAEQAYRFSLTHVLGLVMTALAVSLGAPFWFDILNRFAKIRGSGANPSAPSGRPAGESGKSGGSATDTGRSHAPPG